MVYRVPRLHDQVIVLPNPEVHSTLDWCPRPLHIPYLKQVVRKLTHCMTNSSQTHIYKAHIHRLQLDPALYGTTWSFLESSSTSSQSLPVYQGLLRTTSLRAQPRPGLAGPLARSPSVPVRRSKRTREPAPLDRRGCASQVIKKVRGSGVHTHNGSSTSNTSVLRLSSTERRLEVEALDILTIGTKRKCPALTGPPSTRRWSEVVPLANDFPSLSRSPFLGHHHRPSLDSPNAKRLRVESVPGQPFDFGSYTRGREPGTISLEDPTPPLPPYSCPCCLQLFLDRPSLFGPHLSHLQYCVRQLTGVEPSQLGSPNVPSYALSHQVTYYRCRQCKSVTVLPCVGIRLNGLSPVHCPRCCVSFSDASLKGGFRNPSSFPSPFNLPP